MAIAGGRWRSAPDSVPFTTDNDIKGFSYPRLAEKLQRIEAPREDLIELFGRMIFNAMVG